MAYRQWNLGDARDNLSQIVQDVLNGHQVTICKNGEPAVDLVRTKHKKRKAPKLGTLSGLGVIVAPDWHRGPETDDELVAWMEGRFE